MPASGRLLLLSPHCLSARDLARAARDHVGGKIEEQLYGEARSTGSRQKRKRAAVPGRMMSCAGLYLLKVTSCERFERKSMLERRRCLVVVRTGEIYSSQEKEGGAEQKKARRSRKSQELAKKQRQF